MVQVKRHSIQWTQIIKLIAYDICAKSSSITSTVSVPDLSQTMQDSKVQCETLISNVEGKQKCNFSHKNCTFANVWLIHVGKQQYISVDLVMLHWRQSLAWKECSMCKMWRSQKFFLTCIFLDVACNQESAVSYCQPQPYTHKDTILYIFFHVPY